MRALILLGILAVLVGVAFPDLLTPGRDSSELINWHYSWRQAQAAAGRNKVIVVDVYTEWCGWCKEMDRKTYATPEVAALGGKAVFLKLNAEDGGEGQAFAQKYQVSGYPTTIILDSRGRVLLSQSGYISPPGRFVQMIESARRRGGF